jgi:ribonuclease HI
MTSHISVSGGAHHPSSHQPQLTTNKIYLRGLRVYGYVGLLPEENVLGQWFEVDADLWVNFEAATHTDAITDTLDYRSCINKIETLVQTSKFALIERLAGAIADAILLDPMVQKVRLKIIKRPPIPNFNGSVAVEVERMGSNPELVPVQDGILPESVAQPTHLEVVGKFGDHQTSPSEQAAPITATTDNAMTTITTGVSPSHDEVAQRRQQHQDNATAYRGDLPLLQDFNSDSNSSNQEPPRPQTITPRNISSQTISPQSISPQNKITRIYTDGACSKNPGPGGWGVLVHFEDGTTQELGGGVGHTTNNQMEMQAALSALEFLAAHSPNQRVTLYTDSKYLIDGITKWIKSWKKNGWQTKTNEPVKNRDLWQKIDQLNNAQIHWEWVRGHAGDEGNERCDEIARSYAAKAGKKSGY